MMAGLILEVNAPRIIGADAIDCMSTCSAGVAPLPDARLSSVSTRAKKEASIEWHLGVDSRL
jgi:hypothetical protein